MIRIIYLRSGVILLSKKAYADWLKIQDEYTDYMTSLGPWSLEGVLDFFEQEYGMDDSKWVFAREQIEFFSESKDMILTSD